MKQLIEQIIGILKGMPLFQKILMGCVFLALVGGFVGMFLWTRKIDFQPVYTNVSPEDASQIIEQLKEQKIPYQLIANGTGIMVPADKVYEIRLSMAGSGLPRGGGVGFEIFHGWQTS